MSMTLKDNILKAVKEVKELDAALTICKTPKFRKPTVPPQPSVPPMPPTSGSNAVKPTVKKPCPYKTPCGWCTKWDKKCDKKPYKRGLRIKINPVDDAWNTKIELDDIRSSRGLPKLNTYTTKSSNKEN